MRRRGLNKLAKAWWRHWCADERQRRRRDDYIYERLLGRPLGRHLRPGLIEALVRTAPSAADIPSIGTNFFEAWFFTDGARAIDPFVQARISPGELRACLSGVWPSILTDGVHAGMRIPLPDQDIAWLLDQSAPHREDTL